MNSQPKHPIKHLALTYGDALQELESRPVMPDRAPALDLTLRGLERLGLGPHEICSSVGEDLNRIILVAGTNGKGSVSSTLEALLLSAGERVGLYTSPHLIDTTERIRVGGHDISREQFARVYATVAERTHDLKLSHFEVLTLMAAWIFFSGKEGAPVDRAILEVGMGGLWDSTNAIPHGVAVISSIGKDHERFLGHTLNEIAVNKFGIIAERSHEIPNGITVCHAPLPEEVKSLALKTQQRTQSQWFECANFKYLAKRPQFEAGLTNEPLAFAADPTFSVRTPWGKSPPLKLPGFRGAQNTALALTVFEKLGYSPEKHLQALENVNWPGRMERFLSPNRKIPLYLSGDHNPEGIESLLELLSYYPRTHLHILAGVVKDKDLDSVLSPLFNLSDASVYLTEVGFRRRALLEYGVWFDQAQGAWSSPLRALEEIEARAEPGQIILVTGSLYLIGEVRKALTKSAPAGT